MAAGGERRARRPTAAWKVLVVEDNPDVAALHARLIDEGPQFRVVHTAPNGEAAYRAVQLLQPDLAIVDLAMPGGDGLSFVRRVRRESIPLEVIVVTAARDAASVREAMHLGVIDYLVKPFAPDRMRQALAAFAWRARAFTRPQLAQEEVDLVQASGATRLQRLPKGLRRQTLNAIRQVLVGGETLTADEVGRRVGVARVTARRYLEYLEVTGVAEVERESIGPGRPRNRYRWAGGEG
ncbi:MAG: response regulator [Actinobacteria bacterium]|nr:response regulator [Actinomycetota bacterium]